MNLALLLSTFLSTPWALLPEQLAVLTSLLMQQAGVSNGGAAKAEPAAAVTAPQAARGDSMPRAGNGAIALIPVHGTIVQHGSMWDAFFGATSCSVIGAQLRMAANDDTCAGIVMTFDTPGGSVYGVSELGDEIRALRGVKPVYGIANSLAASAGYWLLSQCEQAYCTPGGEVGSIGVYGAHMNYAKYLSDAGIEPTLVSAGKYKTEGNPYGPLDEEARAAMQGRIDQYYAAFTGAVSKGRGVSIAHVRSDMGQGRVLGAADAKAAGMIDDTDTLDGVIRRMSRALKKPAATNARAAALRELEYLSA